MPVQDKYILELTADEMLVLLEMMTVAVDVRKVVRENRKHFDRVSVETIKSLGDKLRSSDM